MLVRVQVQVVLLQVQEPVPVRGDDTVDTLSARVHDAEHRVLTRAVVLYSEGRVRRDPADPRHMIINDEGGS